MLSADITVKHFDEIIYKGTFPVNNLSEANALALGIRLGATYHPGVWVIDDLFATVILLPNGDTDGHKQNNENRSRRGSA